MQSSPDRDRLGTSVREALAGDAPRIVSLARQLGYEVTQSHVEEYLARLSAERTVYVAVVPRAGVVGWIGVELSRTITSAGRADVHGLVIEDEYRSNGIGAVLLEAAEVWARKRGCSTLRVLSNIKRERAHGFYERSGYEILKTEYVFEKNL